MPFGTLGFARLPAWLVDFDLKASAKKATPGFPRSSQEIFNYVDFTRPIGSFGSSWID